MYCLFVSLDQWLLICQVAKHFEKAVIYVKLSITLFSKAFLQMAPPCFVSPTVTVTGDDRNKTRIVMLKTGICLRSNKNSYA